MVGETLSVQCSAISDPSAVCLYLRMSCHSLAEANTLSVANTVTQAGANAQAGANTKVGANGVFQMPRTPSFRVASGEISQRSCGISQNAGRRHAPFGRSLLEF